MTNDTTGYAPTAAAPDETMAAPTAPHRQLRFLSGLEALVEGILAQRRLDEGLATAAFVSGYRGSPLGGFDTLLWQRRQQLTAADVTFKPGLNEDLAATACWGTQQLALAGEPKFAGVTAYWYGKGPGVDRSGDVIKHASFSGTAPLGGVVMFVGDDHGAKSSTIAHQSDQALMAAGIPVLYPATVSEFVEYTTAAVAMSRHAGVWVAVKCVTEVVEASALVDLHENTRWLVPATGRPATPPSGFQPTMVERSLFEERLPAARSFARINRLDRLTLDAATRTLGIVATGKAFVDLQEALRLLGLDRRAGDLGIRIFKPAMVWPLTRQPILEFCAGHREVLVIEEKRSLVEEQLAGMLLAMPDADRPALAGKLTPAGERLLPEYGELDAVVVARTIYHRLSACGLADDRLAARYRQLAPIPSAPGKALLPRVPAFCSGCPHNRSTKLPDGSMALGGIGCHGMALMVPELRTPAATHMGGEGANWIGMADYVDARHIFQNMGEGTYAHSGLLAIRAAVAAQVNITYKILFNSATAMTGGQPVEGDFTADDIIRQLQAEKVGKIVLVTEYPDQQRKLPAGVAVFPRTELDGVQRTLRDIPGVTALVYEQGCAAERRRLRKQNAFPDPAIRTFINPDVCEGCGDCGQKSNCVSLMPLETELGIKRAVDQDSCNKDYSCVEGFCPSFVTVTGGKLRISQIDETMARNAAKALAGHPVPASASHGNILIAGIGGTGTITLGATLARAAILDGKRVTTFDVTGLAQKNGPVYSHIRVLPDDDQDIYQPRIPAGQLDTLIGCDIVSSSAGPVLPLLARQRSRVFVSHQLVPTASFQRNPGLHLDVDDYVEVLATLLPPDRLALFDAGTAVRRVLGSGALANVALLGFALQQGSLPISPDSIEAALKRGGKPDVASVFALRIGRLIAVDPRLAENLLAGDMSARQLPLAERSLEGIVARAREILTAYQNGAYADRYEAAVRSVCMRDRQGDLGRAYAANLFKLMRYKDEYEVARLYTSPHFMAALRQDFTGDVTLAFNLAPPLFAWRKTATGEPRKMRFGPWMMFAFRLLAKLRMLRGTPIDPFGWSHDRKLERRLIGEYQHWIDAVPHELSIQEYRAAVEIATIPEIIKGYGPVKARNVEAARNRYLAVTNTFPRLRAATVGTDAAS